MNNVFTEHVNKISLSFSYHRKLQSFTRNKKRYPYGESVGKVYKGKLLVIIKSDFKIF